MGMSQFVLRVGWKYEDRGNTMLCGCYSSRNIILYMPKLPMQSSTMSSLSCFRSERQIFAAQHQRLLTDQAHAKKKQSPTDWQTRTYSQELIACVCVRLYLQVCKHANTISSHSPRLSLPSLLTSDKDDAYLPQLRLPVYIQSTI